MRTSAPHAFHIRHVGGLTSADAGDDERIGQATLDSVMRGIFQGPIPERHARASHARPQKFPRPDGCGRDTVPCGNASPSISPWSVSIAPVCTLTRMKSPPHAAQRASAAWASLRSTLKPRGNFTAARMAQPAAVIAAMVSGPDIRLRKRHIAEILDEDGVCAAAFVGAGIGHGKINQPLKFPSQRGAPGRGLRWTTPMSALDFWRKEVFMRGFVLRVIF
jgi:hypothetical protein